MPYNPGVTDISGQLRAQGMIQSSNNQAVNFKGLIGDWMKNEQDRAQASGIALGKIAQNPFIQQAITSDPNMAALATKIQSGKGTLADTQQLLGYTASVEQRQQQAAQQMLMQAQAAQANAQVSDIQSQAQQRDLQNQVLRRNMSIMEQVFNAKNPDSPLTDNPAAAPVPTGGIPAPAPGAVGQFVPQGAPQQQADPFAPTVPPPSRKGVFFNIIKSTGQMPDAKTVDEAYKSDRDKWASIERPLGYVAGGEEIDKDNNKVQTFYPVTIKNDGTIQQAKEPIKMYAGSAPPGRLLDGTTFKPKGNAAVPANAAIPLPAPVLPAETKKEITDTANDINTGLQALKVLDNLQASHLEMMKKRWGALSGVTGGDYMNNTVEPLLGDSTGQQFDQQAARFKADVMANVRNVRNVFEFKAVTGNIPTAAQTPDTRQKALETMRETLIKNIQRNQRAMQLMQAGATPDSAWAAATPDAAKAIVAKPEKASEAKQVMKGQTGTTKEGVKVIYNGSEWVPLK